MQNIVQVSRDDRTTVKKLKEEEQEESDGLTEESTVYDLEESSILDKQ